MKYSKPSSAGDKQKTGGPAAEQTDGNENIIVVPIEDTLDLHTFRPNEISGLLTDYFEACLEKGLVEVKVIHGKGTGMLRAGVLAFLEKSGLVDAYVQAPPESGGWGAVMVKLKTKINQ